MDRILITAGETVASEILIGDGLSLAAELVMPPRPGRLRTAVLGQPGSHAEAEALTAQLRAAGYAAALKILPDREAAKTLEVVQECYLWLNSQQLTRDDAVVAVGGGAATDLGGFVGATYLRGIETALVPTTMLAAVDAAVGGKTAVNIGGKNLAGVFAHPARVIVDTSILAGLPAELLIEGTAEAVKAGFIADIDLVRLYENQGLDAPIHEVVARAIAVKAAVVSSDFTESGRRMILNYGHTVGHAIEHVTGMPHGHAVAIGMVAAGAASERVAGFRTAQHQRNLLVSLQLPVTTSGLDIDQVELAMLSDKKRDASGFRMVLLEEYGRPLVTSVDMTTVRAALSAVGIS